MTERFRRIALAIAAVIGSAVPLSAFGGASSAACPSAAPLNSLNVGSIGQVPAAPATMILPADGRARILLGVPMAGSRDARVFRAFEVSSQSDVTQGAPRDQSIEVLGVAEATAKEKQLLKTSDAVAINLAIPPQMPPWLIRSFVLVACDGEKVGAWGAASAPVSYPTVSRAICVLVGILAYILAMSAVFANRRKQLDSNLAQKYPAVFAARELTGVDFFNPIHLATNAFNQGSVQKLQVVVFSFLIGELVLSLTLNTGILTELSPTVIALLGISGVGAATAQAAYQQKTRLTFENWSWLSNRGVLKIAPPDKSSGPYWRDLVITNREFDIYKVQTIIFSVAVIAEIIVGGAGNLSTFAVPETLLGILGLSQVVYVGGIMVKPPTNADLDDALTKLRRAGDVLTAARMNNTDTDASGDLLKDTSGKLVDVTLAGGVPGANALRQYKALEAPMVDMIESALEVEVRPETLDPDFSPTPRIAPK